MTDKHADIRKSLAKITPGEWVADEEVVWVCSGTWTIDCGNDENAQFIANAPGYVRRLLDEVERLKEQHEGNMEALQGWYEDYHELKQEKERIYEFAMKRQSELMQENDRLQQEVREANERGEWMNDRRQEVEIERDELEIALEKWRTFDEKIKQMFMDNFHLGESRITIADYCQLQMDMGMIEINPDAVGEDEE